MNCARASDATALTLGSLSTATRQRARMSWRCWFRCAAICANSGCESGAIGDFRRGAAQAGQAPHITENGPSGKREPQRQLLRRPASSGGHDDVVHNVIDTVLVSV